MGYFEGQQHNRIWLVYTRYPKGDIEDSGGKKKEADSTTSRRQEKVELIVKELMKRHGEK